MALPRFRAFVSHGPGVHPKPIIPSVVPRQGPCIAEVTLISHDGGLFRVQGIYIDAQTRKKVCTFPFGVVADSS